MGIEIRIDKRLGNCPQFRGGIISKAYDGDESLVEAGLEVAKLINQERPQTKQRQGGKKPTPQERADQAAQNMLATGKYTPQQIGEVTARILGGE